jgi:hypothetical protein
LEGLKAAIKVERFVERANGKEPPETIVRHVISS